MATKNKLILTPPAKGRLVLHEAVNAFRKSGCTVESRQEELLCAEDLARMYTLPPERSSLEKHPDMFFSVNFHGLDKFGENFAILYGKGIPVAVWCVDNPWNLLSGLRTDFWKDTHLFVTDSSFIPSLKANGARRVSFLPLATDPDVFFPQKPVKSNRDSKKNLVFVGRSAFPDKERFFVGQSIPEDIRKESLARLWTGQRTDFSWWLEELNLETSPLWPGSTARKASLGAEESSLAWRAACLHEGTAMGLTLYGDAGWGTQFPADGAKKHTPELRQPLDYYTQLPAVYTDSPFSLNMMSFLLPQGVNQRHFDVWAAGGFCLMDDCQGLRLFPSDLTQPVTFRKPEEIPELVTYFKKNREEKTLLTAAWRSLILEEHTYAIRMQILLERIFA